MKRIFTISTLLLFFFIVTGSINGQETKKEQHIKIVTVDKTGNKIEIDTLIKDGATMDTIILKGGKVVVLRSHGAMAGKLAHISEGKGQIYVTVSSDFDDEKGEKGEKGEKNIEKKIVIVSDDGENIIKKGEGGNVIIMKGDSHLSAGKGEKVVTWSSSEGGSKDESVIYINDGKAVMKSGEKTFDIKVITNDEGKEVEKTKYVIAKNGMVITIEGSDETKVKEMIKDIESKLGVMKEDDSKKTVVKEETKKTTKK